MRPLRSLVLMSCLLLAALSLCGCLGGGAVAPGGGTSLQGTLRNEYGHPVPGALLSVGALTATTGRDGSFRLAGLPSGSQTVAFRAKGYLDRDLTVTIKAGQSNQLTEPAAGGAVILKTIHSAARNQAALSQAMRETQQHTACDSCHSVAAPVGTKFLDANTQALCTQAGCHAAPGGGSWEHPVAHLDNSVIKPAGELAQYDQIGCLRCHVSHAATPGGSLTPGYPATTADNTGYEAFCTDCHNATNPANTYKPATHYGSNCTACHEPNGIAGGHKACTRAEAGCHALSSTLALSPTHRVGAASCANCHDTANGPTDNKLLKSGGGDSLCLTACHDNPKHHRIEQELITASQRSADPAVVEEYVHNVPCQACHNVHRMGAAPDNLVTHPFEKTPWSYPRLAGNEPHEATTLAGYETDFYFCFSCHGGYKNGDYTMYDGTVKNDGRNAERQAWGADWVARGAAEVYWNYAFASKPARTNFAMPGTPYNVDMHPSHFSIRFEHPAGSEPISCESCHGVHTSVQKSLVQNPLAPFVNPPDTYGDVPLHNCIQATTYAACHSSNCHTAAFWP